MKKDDTDPGLGPADQGATDPGPPPETTTDPGPPDAESLLENLGGAPLPAPGIPATDGHVAAAYSAGAHKPPRAHKTAPPEAAVVVEKTRPPEPAVPARGMSDEERAARQARTLPGERLRPPPPREEPPVVPMRSGMGARSLAVALVGVLILAGSVVIVLSRTPATPARPAAGSAAALPVVPSPGVVETTAATAVSAAPVASAPEVPSPEVPSPEASASATVPTPAASPAPSSRAPRPTPRGPSNVVEPERTF